MAKSQPKITLSESRDIPFNKLVLSQSNVRRIKAGVAIEELAEDIARRTLLQSLTVRPVLDESGAETGMYEVPAGGRRYRALELLVKQKRLARTAPVPCIVRTGGIAEEDSLAENVQRAPLHPLDQFRAFLALREKGQSEEEIAAAFFVSVAVVRQRLRLASVSPKLLEVYAEDGMIARPADGVHGQSRPRAPGAGVGGAAARPRRGRRTRSAGCSPRTRCAPPTGGRGSSASPTTRPPAASCCATCSSPTTAAGCRTRPCSTGSSPRSWSGKRRPSAPRDGSGSRSPPTSPTATPTGCAGSAARRCR